MTKIKQNKRRTKKGSGVKTTPRSKSVSLAVFTDPKNLLVVLLLAATTFLVYRGALDNDFVDWDDFTYVINNDLVRSGKDINTNNIFNTQNNIPSKHTTTIGNIFRRSVSSNFHPLTILSMRWNNNACAECTYGISARPFILWNVILHILNVILVFFLIMRLSKDHVLASIAIAAIFALHPMHVESVAWVSERKDVLYTFFFLLGLFTYIEYAIHKSRKWLVFTFALFVLSCLAKGMAVVFPVVMLLIYLYYNLENKWSLSNIKKLRISNLLHTIPFFIVSLLLGLLAYRIQSGDNFMGILESTSDIVVAVNEFDTFGIWQRFQFASYGFWQYIVKFFAPMNLSTYYAYPTQVQFDANSLFTFAPMIVILILALAIYSVKYTKSIFFGIAFFLLTIILVLQFVSVGNVIMADRYTYLAYIGLGITVFFPFTEFTPKKIQLPIFGLVGIWLIFLSLQSVKQIETWQDSEALWTNVIEQAKNGSDVLHENLSMPFATRGSYFGKMSEYHGKKKNPEKQKEYLEKAFNDFITAEQLNTNDGRVYKGLGNVYGLRGEFDMAIESFSKAIAIDPNDQSIYYNRGVTYSNLAKHNQAIADYTKAIELSGNQAIGSIMNRGFGYKALGRISEAKRDFARVLELDPSNQMAQQQLNALN